MKQKLLLVLFALLTSSTVWADVEINETNFPDENFRGWVLSQEYGADGVLKQSEIKKVTRIDVKNLGIQNLKGIEHFTALTMLICIDNQLTELDVSQNLMMDSLFCYNNHLTALDVSELSALTVLGCYNNQLTTLDVSKNTALNTLSCSDNQLTELDVSENLNLVYLYCSDNQLTALDVSNHRKLGNLVCYKNQLTVLNISGCSNLTYLYCYNNYIKGEAMDALVNAFSSSMFSNTMCVIGNEDEHNEITVAQVATAYSRNWIPYAYVTMEDGSIKRVRYPGIDARTTDVVINEENFPDPVFREWVLSQKYGSDGVLTTAELMDAWYLSIYNMGIQSLKGIEFFVYATRLKCSQNQLAELDISKNVGLTSLNCDHNQLKELDISQNPNLVGLMCNNNQLEELDVSKHVRLTELWCDYNQLKELDVSQNILLTQLYCGYNQLPELDISKNTMLTDLRCQSNQLTALDVSACTQLTKLYFFMNQIYGSAMDELIESLPTVKKGETYVIYYKNEQNVMTKAQVAAAKTKGWIPSYYYNGWREYSGSDPITGDLNGDGKIDIADAVNILSQMAEGRDSSAADLNGDGKVDIADFVSVLNLMVGQ